jgi:hypothetical protein
MRAVYDRSNLNDPRLVCHALVQVGMLAFVRADVLVGRSRELAPFGLLSVAVADSGWVQARHVVERVDVAIVGEIVRCPA